MTVLQYFSRVRKKKVRGIIQMEKEKDVAPLVIKITQCKKMIILADVMCSIQYFESECTQLKCQLLV